MNQQAASKTQPRRIVIAAAGGFLGRSLVSWFRAQGAGWQTRMNAVLKAYRDALAQPVTVAGPSRPSSARVRRRTG